MEMNTIQSLPKQQCTGCAACVNRCPTDCISMQSDTEGFLYPVLDESKCIRCRNCNAACPVLSPPARPESEQAPSCYAAWSKDEQIRFQSTSGGVFTHLAQAVLSQGGFVAGARYRTDHLVEHVLISSEADLEPLRQSKYVQSEIGLVYREIRERLQQQKPVLFAGTPCQCAGLKAFLGREYDELYLCDFICRGVNSPEVYLTYLRELEKRYGAPVKRVWFKNKTYGWNRFCTKIIFEDGQEYLADRETDPFMLGYIKTRLSCYIRPSCYDCRFKGVHRPVEITLGDFWGAGIQNPELDPDKGTSLLIVHTEKGKKLFAAAHGLILQPSDLNQALSKNPCAVQSVPKAADRQRFFRELSQRGFFESISRLSLDPH